MYINNSLQISNKTPDLIAVLRIVHIIGAKNESLKEKKDCRLATILNQIQSIISFFVMNTAVAFADTKSILL